MKRLTALVLTLSLAFTLAACGQKPSDPAASSVGDPSASQSSPPSQTPPDTPDPPKAPVIPKGDSFWTAYQLGEGSDANTLPQDSWSIDLTLWEDGTARIRNIEGGTITSYSEFDRRLTWEQTDGSFKLYSPYAEAPRFSGSVTEEGIRLDDFHGEPLLLKQEKMPDSTGMLYCPAELEGVWIMTSAETEGYEWEALPGHFETITIQPRWSDAQSNTVLQADCERGGYYGPLPAEFRDYGLEILDQPLYSGCGNEEWSVRLGPESPKNSDGHPLETEYYVTLLDHDTMLRQMYYTLDSAPAVSYQTFRRVLPINSSWPLEQAVLDNTAWECTYFTDDQGVRHSAPPGLSEFTLQLLPDNVYSYSTLSDSGEAYSAQGTWVLGSGGTLLLYHEDYPEDWFAGAARVHHDHAVEDEGFTEMFLHYQGGVIRLIQAGFAGDQDTMDELEGNAFAAPGDALLVLYSDQYLDMDWYEARGIPALYAADGPDVRRFLVTAVNDHTTLWLENDGFVVQELGELFAGESLIVQTGVSESGGSLLCFRVNGTDYRYELTTANLDFYDGWSYLSPA